MPHGNVVRRKTIKEKTFTVIHISYTWNGKLRYNAWRNRRRSSTLENEKRAIREGTVACTGEHNLPESKRKKRLGNIRGALHDSVSRAQNFARFPFCHIFGSSIYLPTYIYIIYLYIYIYIISFLFFFYFKKRQCIVVEFTPRAMRREGDRFPSLPFFFLFVNCITSSFTFVSRRDSQKSKKYTL